MTLVRPLSPSADFTFRQGLGGVSSHAAPPAVHPGSGGGGAVSVTLRLPAGSGAARPCEPAHP